MEMAVANRSKVTLFFAVLATGFLLVSGAATCQANDNGRAVVVEAVQAAASHGDIGSDRATGNRNQVINDAGDVGTAREAETADRSNNGGDMGAARDTRDSDKGDVGISR